jgi:hypothetical protein
VEQASCLLLKLVHKQHLGLTPQENFKYH